MNRSALSPIEKRVKEHLETTFTGPAVPRLVAGISGGPDSMALLHIFKILGVSATVVHVNYRKRGDESNKDEELVEEISNLWGFGCHTVRLDPEDADGTNFQQWARRKRYRIFAELCREYGADGIAVAHHRDDQVETVLQKLFRGAGLASWGGMSVWDEPLFRPLLDSDRNEILNYIERKEIPYRTDRSNLESDFARNLLRNEWLDKLERFFPGWKKNVLRLPEQAGLFGKALKFIEERLTDGGDRIDLDAFMGLDAGLRKALILQLVKHHNPSVELSTGALDQIQHIRELQPGKMIRLNERYSIVRDRGYLKIVYEHRESYKSVKIKRADLEQGPLRFNSLFVSLEGYENPDFGRAIYLDSQKINWPIVIRPWQAGDRFQPFGMEGHQKVSDHLTNRKVSSTEKGKALVLESFEETICAVIFPPIEKMNPPGTISELVKCGEETAKCLIIECRE